MEIQCCTHTHTQKKSKGQEYKLIFRKLKQNITIGKAIQKHALWWKSKQTHLFQIISRNNHIFSKSNYFLCSKLNIVTCFVFHVKRDCKSADIFSVMLTCRNRNASTSDWIMNKWHVNIREKNYNKLFLFNKLWYSTSSYHIRSLQSMSMKHEYGI